MKIYPAIDIYQGRVVRLERGDYAKETVYSEHPEEIAQKWEAGGASWIHMVDLEGAKTGRVSNSEAIRKIRERVNCSLQLGGGLRSVEQVREVLGWGINRVVIGTRALDEVFLKELLGEFGDQIALGLDCRNGKVQLEGWLKESNESLEELLGRLQELDVRTIIYTDIAKDGMLQGPNFEGLEHVLSLTSANVILSGGVSSLEDIQRSSQITAPNFEGPIIGKALYENRLELTDAVALEKV